MMLSGEIVASETWDSTAYKLFDQNKNIVFVPPEKARWPGSTPSPLPRKGKADDAAYKWINFVLRPENVTMMSASTGAIAAVKGGKDLLPEDKKAAVNAAFTDADIDNLKFFANIPPGVEDMEGKTLRRSRRPPAADPDRQRDQGLGGRTQSPQLASLAKT
jgi:spermidine/putrescine transport system substrate-binding protein